MARIDKELAALATMSPAQLRGEWLQAYRRPVPTVGHVLIGLALAYRAQARASGGLSAPVARELDALARQLDRAGSLKLDNGPKLKPGTRLVREWGGVVHQVLFLESGYVYQDRSYRSLSQIAQVITGTNWSGPRFFGLIKAKPKKAATRTEAADGAIK